MGGNKERTFVCAGCGITVTKRCQADVKFCSHKCYTDHRDYQLTAEKRKTGETKICPICKKLFYVAQNRKEAVTCSVVCANKWQGRNKVTRVCETCKKIFAVSKSFENQRFCSVKCKNDSEWLINKLARDRAKQSLLSPNKFEQKAYLMLDSYGITYIPQYTINGKFVVDAFIPEKNTVIQFDGDYWHGNPEKYQENDLDRRQAKRKALDISQDAYMQKIGIKVIRIWQSEINDSEIVEKKFKEILKTED